MSQIVIRRPHGLSHTQARSVAEQMAAHLHQRLQMVWEWQGDTLHFQRSGVKGQVAVGAEELLLDIRLGLLLAPMKSRIEQEIESYIAERLAVAGT